MKDMDSGEEIVTKRVQVREQGGGIVSTMKRINEITYVIPQRIKAILKGMTVKYPEVEFSICVKTTFDEDRGYYRPDEQDIFIPEQHVSAAHIDYLEDDPSYNTVFHKHPNGCRQFSGTDRDYINGNFRFSILWVDNKFAVAIANIRLEHGIFMEVPMRLVEEETIPLFPSIAEEKVICSNREERHRPSSGRACRDSRLDVMLGSRQLVGSPTIEPGCGPRDLDDVPGVFASCGEDHLEGSFPGHQG